MPEVIHTYDSDLCNLRVMWAWSRRPENIIFTDEATRAILKHATLMGRKYTSKIPIVEAADQRITIARLAVSCACCMFSTENGNDVIVKEEHVEYVVGFMHKIYSSKSFGYDKLSEIEAVNSDSSDVRIEDLVNSFLLLPVADFNELVNTLYMFPYFSRNTLDDATSLPRDDLKLLTKFLINNHLVEKVRGDYRRQPLGTEFLEYLRANPITKERIDQVRLKAYSEY
ncbi:hypothetical protein D3C80_1208670 [compost metagenome]